MSQGTKTTICGWLIKEFSSQASFVHLLVYTRGRGIFFFGNQSGHDNTFRDLEFIPQSVLISKKSLLLNIFSLYICCSKSKNNFFFFFLQIQSKGITYHTCYRISTSSASGFSLIIRGHVKLNSTSKVPGLTLTKLQQLRWK